MVKVLLFAESSEVYNAAQLELPYDRLDKLLLSLMDNLKFKTYFLNLFPNVKLAINQTYILEKEINENISKDDLEGFLEYYYAHIALDDNDVVAVIPPVSGG